MTHKFYAWYQHKFSSGWISAKLVVIGLAELRDKAQNRV